MSYKELNNRESSESQFFKEETTYGSSGLEEYQTSKSFQGWRWIPFILSALLNLALAYPLIIGKRESGCETDFAGLSYDVSSPFPKSTEYSKSDFHESNEHWDAINFDIGVVALDKSYAERKSLPSSQPFPWDNRKGIYFLNGFHSLHCAKTLHISLVEFKLSKPQTYPFHHVMHCLDALRVEIICHADDTPRYTTTTHDTLSGVGQDRKCRDWGKLERWALENDACYHYFNHSFNEVIDQRQRYVFCEPGSPYAATVEKYLGQNTGL